MPSTIDRRTALQSSLGLGLAVSFGIPAHAAKDPASTRPQENDRFVFNSGDRTGEIIKFADIKLGEKQTFAFPKDVEADVVREASRFNKVMIIRFEPETLSEETRELSVDGVLAFSAICTHQGCDVSEWLPKEEVLYCFCHFSKYNPYDMGRVVQGPATRKLPLVPLKDVDGEIVAASGFTTKPGFKKK